MPWVLVDLASISASLAAILDSNPHLPLMLRRSCFALICAVFFIKPFAPPPSVALICAFFVVRPSRRIQGSRLLRVVSGASDGIIRMIDTSRGFRVTTPFAAAEESLTTGMIGPFADTGTIPPPRRPPRPSERELSRNRRRHSFSIRIPPSSSASCRYSGNPQFISSRKDRRGRSDRRGSSLRPRS